MADNMYSKDHKGTNKKYRDNYDLIFAKSKSDRKRIKVQKNK